MKTTESIFNEILSSDLFRLSGHQIDLLQSIIGLCEAIQDEEETNWELGELGECCLSDFIVCAFWALTECHSGQYSQSYAALSAVGDIFNPGMTYAPGKEDPEHSVYDLICVYLLKEKDQTK